MREKCTCDCIQSKVPAVRPQRRHGDKSSRAVLLRGQAFLIDVFLLFIPPLPGLFNIRKDPASFPRYFNPHESSSNLNHVLGCQPSPPMSLILPEPLGFCPELRMKLREA